MKKLIPLFLFLFVFSLASAAQDAQKFLHPILIISGSLMTAFKQLDSLQQIQFIQTLYIDKGTNGLKAFMVLRNYNAKLW
jgi:predicted CDP-diglyceride synthetase/phosphatidate cytidylyltransferase